MGCVCCSLSSFVSIVLDALERISLCTVCALLTCCLLFTVLTIMVIGMGIGFNYCFVSNSVDSMAKAAKAAGALRSGPQTQGHVMRSVEKAVRRGFAHRFRQRRDADGDAPYNNTMYSQLSNFTSEYLDNPNITSSSNITELYQPNNNTLYHSFYRNLTQIRNATNFIV